MVRSWRHSEFQVYTRPRIQLGEEEGMENLARYIIRASFSQERMPHLSEEFESEAIEVWGKHHQPTARQKPLSFSPGKSLLRIMSEAVPTWRMENVLSKRSILKRLLVSGLGLMLLAAFIFSFTDILIKDLSSSCSATQIAFVRFFLGGFILWPLLSLEGISLRGNQTRILILRGVFGTLSFFCLLKSIAMIPLSNAIVLHYTFPLFAALFSFLFFKIALEKREIILILIGLIGIYILTNPDFHSFNHGYLLGFLSGCFGGIAMVLAHQARQTNGPFVIYFYFCLIGGMITSPLILQNFKVPNIQHGILLILISLTLLIGQVLMNHGLKFCRASEGSLILMSEVVFTGIAGFIIFKDPVTWNFLTGALLIVGSGVGLNLMSRASRHPLVS